MNLLTKKNNFLFLLMIVFVFVSSSAMSLSKQTKTISNQEIPIYTQKTFPSLPVLGTSTNYPVLSAQGVLAVDVESGKILYEKSPDLPLLPASTTKIVTALVSLDIYKIDQVFKVGQEVNVDGQKMGLFYGEKINFESLLNGLLIYSANDAAETLAHNYPTGYDSFITAMNAKAYELSMTNSHFDNPVGLDTDTQRSTARDLVRVSEVAMRNPLFKTIVGTKEVVVADESGKYSYDLKNVNQLLGSVPGVVGVKTGWTENARENLVTYIERDGHKIIIAILGSTDRFGETKDLINWIFENYKWNEVIVRSMSG